VTSTDTPGVLLVDEPLAGVRRFTLNRPERRNALNNELRGALLDGLAAADDDEAVRVAVIRGAGPSFCSGYDLGSDLSADRPYHSAGGPGSWSRHVAQGWFGIWDLGIPVIAQVHGHAMAGGSELAAACDLVYCATDAIFSYPVTRLISPPDFQYHPWLVSLRSAMELVLTGDPISGEEAARVGLVNRAVPADALEAHTLAMAGRLLDVPRELLQINKRSVHRAFEIMGSRTAMRAGSELQGLASGLASTRDAATRGSAAVKAAGAASRAATTT
jgi:enoyl-CoA hydratase